MITKRVPMFLVPQLEILRDSLVIMVSATMFRRHDQDLFEAYEDRITRAILAVKGNRPMMADCTWRDLQLSLQAMLKISLETLEGDMR